MTLSDAPNVPLVAMPGRKSELPPRISDHFFEVANKRIGELHANGESQARIGRRWGVSQNTINKIMQRTGGFGVKALVGMRLDLRMSIDEILGLPPFDDGPRSQLRTK